MEHPFHLHGFFFQVLDDDGAAPLAPAWKDTVNLRGETTVSSIAWMPDDRPGRWMYHCHILEHHQGGHDGQLRRGPLITGQAPRTARLRAGGAPRPE